uniref:Uncharacterized protein n=1 Tax=Chromera velia CCMP2878 TaxID=1169474 RepID=A0A0G4HDJ6_9ALVE|eukprot:Cvel_6448.t1-p1 / transcript=Cvel_6448.t1 / gene=Cvel_6448 / organism=Chromera_velia_CCMP2878 / gene_product=hypothetical protein / transcript_product=hypothetical protein / location=Cvel_scaffold315:95478-97307(+) / protein_length=251 / sequence_SO=supercontig / SO=protein_coding / is_pseudo=false
MGSVVQSPVVAVSAEGPALSEGPEKFPHTEYERKSIPWFWASVAFSSFYIVFAIAVMVVGWIYVLYNLLYATASVMITTMTLSGQYLCLTNNDFWWAVAYVHLIGAVYWTFSLPLHSVMIWLAVTGRDPWKPDFVSGDHVLSSGVVWKIGVCVLVINVAGLVLYAMFAWVAMTIANGMGARRCLRMRAAEEARAAKNAEGAEGHRQNHGGVRVEAPASEKSGSPSPLPPPVTATEGEGEKQTERTSAWDKK